MSEMTALEGSKKNERKKDQMLQIVTLITILLYIIMVVSIALYCYRTTKTMDSFLLGSRKVGPWVSAFSYGTSYFSAVIFIGYAGMFGWIIGAGSILIGVGNAAFGSLVAWLLLAKPTRRMTHRIKAKTMPEFFAKRYECRNLKIYAAVIIFLFLVPYAAGVYKGLGSLFSAVFPGVPEETIMLLVALLTATGLFLGGYKATSLIDFFQGIIMLTGVTAMIIVVISQPEVGGLFEGFQKLKNIDPDLISPFGGKNWFPLLINISLTSFAVWGLPQMVHKYYAIKDESSIKQGTVIATMFALVIGGGAYLVGTFGRLFVPALPDGTPDAAGSFDGVMPEILMSVFSSNIFLIILLSIIMLLLLSASMSTLEALVLSSSSAVAVDLLGTLRPGINEIKQMFIMRGFCVLFVALSYIFATMNISFIVNLMSFSWGVVAGCFIGPFLWGLYWKGVTKMGAWAGALSGLVTVTGLTVSNTFQEGFAAAKSMAPQFGVTAMIVSLAAVPIVSLFTKKFSRDHIDRCFKDGEKDNGSYRQ